MTDPFKRILGILALRFKARATLEAENLVLRQQVNVLRRRTPKRPHLNDTDRFLFVWLYRWFPSVLKVVAIVRPEIIIRWHRDGFRAYWRWRSRNPYHPHRGRQGDLGAGHRQRSKREPRRSQFCTQMARRSEQN
jgi:hypothetical protein